ncbi:MAG TPA: cytochrome P460 family protein [Caulobacteraceae bacterium]|nr:cytochrome P460 family protein [Caulobacteraceae bacterium]
MAQIAKRLLPLALLLLGAAPAPEAVPGPGAGRFTADGALIPPADYREWVYLSSGLDMSYSDAPAIPGMSMFDNVFVDPAAWAAFKKTGHWPDGAVFVLESRGATSQGSINKHGQYQNGDRMGFEAHIRDEKRFKGGWGFFAFTGAAPARMIPYSASCYACHQAHAAVDTTFTQFYPTAKPIAVKAGTYLDR